MKRTLVFALLILFLANTTIASAWAPACMDDMHAASLMAEMDMVGSAAPCHQAEEEQLVYGHCSDLCLCVYAASIPSFLIKFGNDTCFPSMAGKDFSGGLDIPVSVDHVPSMRPPKNIS